MALASGPSPVSGVSWDLGSTAMSAEAKPSSPPRTSSPGVKSNLLKAYDDVAAARAEPCTAKRTTAAAARDEQVFQFLLSPESP